MTARSSPAPGDPPATGDADRWQEAARLRREHPRWIVLWLSPIGRFRAYRRLAGTRRDTTLTAPTARDLASLITQAEHAATTPGRHPKDSR